MLNEERKNQEVNKKEKVNIFFGLHQPRGFSFGLFCEKFKLCSIHFQNIFIYTISSDSNSFTAKCLYRCRNPAQQGTVSESAARFPESMVRQKNEKDTRIESEDQGPTPFWGEGAQSDQVSFIVCFQAGEYVQGRENMLSEAYGAIWLSKIG